MSYVGLIFTEEAFQAGEEGFRVGQEGLEARGLRAKKAPQDTKEDERKEGRSENKVRLHFSCFDGDDSSDEAEKERPMEGSGREIPNAMAGRSGRFGGSHAFLVLCLCDTGLVFGESFMLAGCCF